MWLKLAVGTSLCCTKTSARCENCAFPSDLYRCATMKPRARVMPPGQGRTVVCLTHLKSLSPRRNKDLKVGLHRFQPLLRSFVVETLSHQLMFVSGLNLKKKKKHHLICLAWLRWWNEHGCVVHLMRGGGGLGGCFKGEVMSSITLKQKPAVCFWQGGNNAPFPSAQWAWPLTGW